MLSTDLVSDSDLTKAILGTRSQLPARLTLPNVAVQTVVQSSHLGATPSSSRVHTAGLMWLTVVVARDGRWQPRLQ